MTLGYGGLETSEFMWLKRVNEEKSGAYEYRCDRAWKLKIVAEGAWARIAVRAMCVRRSMFETPARRTA